jgi:hypothetical protein
VLDIAQALVIERQTRQLTGYKSEDMPINKRDLKGGCNVVVLKKVDAPSHGQAHCSCNVVTTEVGGLRSCNSGWRIGAR